MPTVGWIATWTHSGPRLGPCAERDRHDADVARALQAAQPHLARLIQRLLGWADKHAVEDAVQEALLRAWTRRGQFRGDAAFQTWLHRIAVHTARNHRRGLFRHRRALGGPPTHLLGEILEPADAAKPLGEDLAQRERHEAVRAAVQGLPQRHREILVLHYLEGHSVAELQAILGLRRNTADARLSRARRAMADHLRAHGWEELP